jgi:cobalt/nickel transport system permease protein
LSEQGVLMFLDVLGKAAVSIGCVAALGAVEPVPGIMRGMQRLRFPAVFVSLVAFTHRYVVVLVDEARRMKRARDARAFGARWLWQARTIGHMIGNLFLRSVERAERVYYAMASRGYEGGALKVAPKALSGAEWMMIAASVVVIVAVRFLLP